VLYCGNNMDLSHEILVEVMLNVESSQIYKLALTSKSIANILSENYFWRRRYEHDGLYPSDESVNSIVSRLHSYTIACRIKKRLSILDREQSFPQMFICARKCTIEELRFIFFSRPEMFPDRVPSKLYRLTLGVKYVSTSDANIFNTLGVNKKKEFYFIVDTYKEITGNGFLLRHNLSNTVLKDSCSISEMRKLLYRCYMLN
jgi:hypothetical protein